ncbi:MAG: hypothetical protein P8Z37_04130 [Acidobacteriota bacterium]
MKWTYEKIAQWFEKYFEDVCRYQGDLETVPNLKQYFSKDMRLFMYTSPSSPPAVSMSRDDLLVSFVHPGLQEDIVPQHLAIDMEKMIVAVQFSIHFADKPTNKKWEPLQASAHYHMTVGDDGGLKISKIFYWTEKLPEDLFEIWDSRREEALKT